MEEEKKVIKELKRLERNTKKTYSLKELEKIKVDDIPFRLERTRECVKHNKGENARDVALMLPGYFMTWGAYILRDVWRTFFYHYGRDLMETHWREYGRRYWHITGLGIEQARAIKCFDEGTKFEPMPYELFELYGEVWKHQHVLDEMSRLGVEAMTKPATELEKSIKKVKRWCEDNDYHNGLRYL